MLVTYFVLIVQFSPLGSDNLSGPCNCSQLNLTQSWSEVWLNSYDLMSNYLIVIAYIQVAYNPIWKI